MGAIADLFRDYGEDYIRQFTPNIPHAHIKAINNIRKCRTIDCGINIYKCDDCGQSHYRFKGCGSRNCPNCQQHKANGWLAKRLEDRLPGPHFMITFTVPEELRTLIRSMQKDAYDAMFQASAEALRQLAKDPRFIGCDLPGFYGILHTWGRQLHYHPHIHYIVPGGGIDRKTKTWKSSREDFFVSVHALSKLFRGKLRAAFRDKGIPEADNPALWQTAFVVNSQAVGSNPQGAIKYLAPYVFKVAIADSRIVSVNNRKVTFRYKKSGSERWRRMTLDVFEFIRRFLQHVLPSGFMKVRYYGFMNGSCKIPIKEVAAMIELANGFRDCLDYDAIEPPQIFVAICAHCGGTLKLTQTILPYEMVPG